jgi:hypothetical protein
VFLGLFDGGFVCGTAVCCGVACVVVDMQKENSQNAFSLEMLAGTLRSFAEGTGASSKTAAFPPLCVFRSGELQTEEEASDAEFRHVEKIEVTTHLLCFKAHHTSHVTRHTSHFTPHTSHLTPHTSHLTPHTSHLTPHTSHATRCRPKHTIIPPKLNVSATVSFPQSMQLISAFSLLGGVMSNILKRNGVEMAWWMMNACKIFRRKAWF